MASGAMPSNSVQLVQRNKAGDVGDGAPRVHRVRVRRLPPPAKQIHSAPLPQQQFGTNTADYYPGGSRGTRASYRDHKFIPPIHGIEDPVSLHLPRDRITNHQTKPMDPNSTG